ncbi:hypothetical protein [Castellaniella caeni]|uniref:hypothetical protein n=1 Tax=Castellaniella caeni TaxID=266123 RepID=UPI0011AF902C|nr:hypothetical protein [Castellaniella caeni]
MMADKLIIDANLLLLLVIGALDNGGQIKNSKRLGGYDWADYEVVVKLMGTFRSVHITPYIAAEVSNLIDLRNQARTRAFAVAKVLFSEFGQVDSLISRDVGGPVFLGFGITDASLVELAKSYTILTNDSRLLPLLWASCEANILPFDQARQIVRQGSR